MPWMTASATRRRGGTLPRDLEIDWDRDDNTNRSAPDAPGAVDRVQNDRARLATERGVRALENPHGAGLDAPCRVDDRLNQDPPGNASTLHSARIHHGRVMEERRPPVHGRKRTGTINTHRTGRPSRRAGRYTIPRTSASAAWSNTESVLCMTCSSAGSTRPLALTTATTWTVPSRRLRAAAGGYATMGLSTSSGADSISQAP